MIPQQAFTQWQQNSVQGAVPSASPLTPADEAFLAETLIECQTRLKMALQTAQTYSRLPDLATGLGDAITGCVEALAVVQDPQKYID
jgi:hypothetical protein